MGKSKNEPCTNDEIISKTLEELNQEKEQNFVKLMIEIIVSLTLKELYGEDDQALNS